MKPSLYFNIYRYYITINLYTLFLKLEYLCQFDLWSLVECNQSKVCLHYVTCSVISIGRTNRTCCSFHRVTKSKHIWYYFTGRCSVSLIKFHEENWSTLKFSEGCLTPTWPPLNSVLPFIKYPVLNTEIIADPSSYVILNDKSTS